MLYAVKDKMPERERTEWQSSKVQSKKDILGNQVLRAKHSYPKAQKDFFIFQIIIQEHQHLVLTASKKLLLIHQSYSRYTQRTFHSLLSWYIVHLQCHLQLPVDLVTSSLGCFPCEVPSNRHRVLSSCILYAWHINRHSRNFLNEWMNECRPNQLADAKPRSLDPTRTWTGVNSWRIQDHLNHSKLAQNIFLNGSIKR